MALGTDRIGQRAAGMNNAVIGEGGVAADQLRQTVRERQSGSLWDTMPSMVGGAGAFKTPSERQARESGSKSVAMLPGPVEARLPARGDGFTTYRRKSRGANQVGAPGMIDAIRDLGADWSQTGHAPIALGDISRAGGGHMSGHEGHRDGLEVDVRPFRHDGRNAPTTWSSGQYDRATTRQFVEMVRGRHPGATILFNDPQLIREGLVQHYDGHDDHLHLRLGGRQRR